MGESEQDQPAESSPARPSSVWADMILSGPDDQEEPEPDAPGTGYGGYRPLGSLPPSGPRPRQPAGRGAGQPSSPDQPLVLGQPSSPDQPLVPGQPQPGAEVGPQTAFGPWETYETEEGYGWTGSYGMVPGQPEAQDYAAGTGGSPGGAPADHGQEANGQEPAYGSYAAHRPYEPYGCPAAPGIAAPGPAATAEAGTGVRGGEAPPGHKEQREPGGRPTWQDEWADSLTADLLLPGRHAAPPVGWRRRLFRISGGLVRAPQSAAEQHRGDLITRVRAPVRGRHHRVAVLSLKGGVGKTTTAVGLGATLASLRGDRIIAVDANPDRGTLSDKFRLETAATVRDVLNEEGQIQRYADVRAYTTQAASGLEVLTSDRDPTVSVAFSAQDYQDVARILELYYAVCVTDCGTGLLHSAMAGVLRLADQIVLVTSPSVDGARSASATLDWLAAHQYGDLVRGAVVVISAIRPRSKSGVDLAQHFTARCRAVVRIPYDAHLAEGAELDLGRLNRATADAYLVLAAEVGDGFSRPRHKRLT